MPVTGASRKTPGIFWDNGGAVINVKHPDYGAIGNGSANDYAAVLAAVTAAAVLGGQVVLPPSAGTYKISTNLTIPSNVRLHFSPGAVLAPDAGVTITHHGSTMAGPHQCYGTAGTVLLTGDVLPQWFGAIADRASPTVGTCQTDTLAFRKACKSFQTEWAAQQTFARMFRLVVPPGMYSLANGFGLPTGQAVVGTGLGVALIRILQATKDPAEPEIGGIVIGATLTGSAGTLALSTNTALYAAYPASGCIVEDLYFIADSATRPAVDTFTIAGVTLDRLFFTSCGVGIRFSDGCADIVAGTLTFDMGLVHVIWGACHNVTIGESIHYLGNYQHNVTGLAYDCQIQNLHSEYAQYAVVQLAAATRNFCISNFQIVANIQYGTYLGSVYVAAANAEITLRNGTVTNIPGKFINSGVSGARVLVENVTGDQRRTTSAYNQGTTMGLLTQDAGEVIFRNVEMLACATNPIVLNGAVNATKFSWLGGKVTNSSATGRVINALTANCTVRLEDVDDSQQIALSVTGANLSVHRVRDRGLSADRGDASVTLDSFVDIETQRWATTLTANRTITLSTTNSVKGDRFRIVRTGLGAFTLAVGALKTIPSATAAFVWVQFDGTAWQLTEYGTL